MNTTDRRRVFRTYPVLQQLPPLLLRKLDEVAAPVQVLAGQPMFSDGSPCTHYPLLIEGTIRVSKPSVAGQKILMYRLNPGESCVITALALLGDGAYPAVGTAETKLSLFGVPKSVFLEMVVGSPTFRAFVFTAVSKRMAQLMVLVDEVAFQRVNQRLASRLLDQVEPFTGTHQTLADELGTTREAVSRTLEAFQQSGLIRLSRKRIEVVDRNGLDRLHRTEGR